MELLNWNLLDEAGRARALARPVLPGRERIAPEVAAILAEVRAGGDAALRRLSARFDGVVPERFAVGPEEMRSAEAGLAPEDRAALAAAYANLRAFHAAQARPALRVETVPDLVCERLVRPIGRVGLYVPGGTAPLPSTVLMLGVPAMLAGCGEIVLCTPPRPDGSVNPWILAAAQLCGIRRVFRLGGAQAIAAMAFGTESVPKVDKLFGPGNAWVTEAKQQAALAAGGAALDLPAGPSEVMVIADAGADPGFVAADLLSQAEHGPDSQALLLCFAEGFARRVRDALDAQLSALPRAGIARQALGQSRILLVADRRQALAVANAYAPEHLILAVREPRAWLPGVATAGSVFLGDYTPESLGDYASGTNHVLPTFGHARAYGGLSLADFERGMSVQQAGPAGLARIAPVVTRLAEAEGLAAHAEAVRVRLAALALAEAQAVAP